MPKIFLNGQFYFNLSSKTWSHIFLEHSVVIHCRPKYVSVNAIFNVKYWRDL